MNVLIVGFPYVREEYRRTFYFYPDNNSLYFLLPRIWRIKGGKVIFQPERADNIWTTSAFFHHSHYPIIGGLLKGFMPAFAFVLFKRRAKVDLVYSCSEPSLLTTLYYGCTSKLLGKKHVVFSWENIPFENKSWGVSLFLKQMIIRMNLYFSDGLVCGNKKGKEIYQQYTKKPITVIPMSGVDDQFFNHFPVEKKIRGQDFTHKIVFTFAGSISYRKGLDNMLQAFGNVIRNYHHVHLIIAGSGEYEREIDARIHELDLSPVVTRLAWLDRAGLRELLNISDVFLYPSLPHGGWEEQFGYSMAEASLMELPIIATRSGSTHEVVQDGVTGLLVEPGHPQALAEAMKRLGTDPDLRRAMGKAGRAFIAEEYSYVSVAKKFYAFFHTVRAH